MISLLKSLNKLNRYCEKSYLIKNNLTYQRKCKYLYIRTFKYPKRLYCNDKTVDLNSISEDEKRFMFNKSMKDQFSNNLYKKCLRIFELMKKENIKVNIINKMITLYQLTSNIA